MRPTFVRPQNFAAKIWVQNFFASLRSAVIQSEPFEMENSVPKMVDSIQNKAKDIKYKVRYYVAATKCYYYSDSHNPRILQTKTPSVPFVTLRLIPNDPFLLRRGEHLTLEQTEVCPAMRNSDSPPRLLNEMQLLPCNIEPPMPAYESKLSHPNQAYIHCDAFEKGACAVKGAQRYEEKNLHLDLGHDWPVATEEDWDVAEPDWNNASRGREFAKASAPMKWADSFAATTEVVGPKSATHSSILPYPLHLPSSENYQDTHTGLSSR